MLHENHNVSVLIRTRDIESRLQELLRRLSHQTLQPSELIIVDNFSSKKKLEDMNNFLLSAKEKIFSNRVHVRLVPIVDGEFSYAYSANVGVAVAISECVCITNGHSLPCSNIWLESGVAHFGNSKVAGVGGYSTPHKNGTFWEKLAYKWWSGLNKISKAYAKDTYFSTTNCILRKSLWEKYPFDEKMPEKIPNAEKFGGEDYDWSIEMMERGYQITVEPKFNVYHSHKETLSQLASKYITWRRIRKKIRSLKRPRKSYTRLEKTRPLYYIL
jgi:glycosyltransferase involved in cell wall biosynthesis